MTPKRCLAKESNEQCTHTTKHPTGLCPKHRQEFEKYFSSLMLRCIQCPVRDFCKFEDQAPEGLCYFELYDRSTRWDDVGQLDLSMRRVLRAEYFLYTRIQRILAHRPGATEDVKLLKEFHTIGDKLFQHFEAFAKFKGWYVPKKKIEKEEKKTLEYIKKVLMMSDKEDEEDIITIKVPEIKEVGDDTVSEDEHDNASDIQAFYSRLDSL